MPQEIKLEMSPQLKQVQAMMGAMKLAEFMNLSQKDYGELIEEIENSLLFKKLMRPGKFTSPEDRIVSYRKFPGTHLTKRYFSELNLSITPDRSSSNLDSLIEKGKDVTSLIKDLGIDKFKKYFLEARPGIGLEEIAGDCQLSLEEVKKINSFLDTFYIQSEFDHSDENEQVNRITFSTVASIEETEKGFSLGYFSRDFVKGRYSINYEKFAELRKSGNLDKKEVKAIESLFNKLRLINTREGTLYKIIQSIIEIQKDYLKSGDPQDLKPFTQLSLSEKIEVGPSMVSRAIRRKAVATPKGGEIPLKFFFPSRKEVLKMLIKEIIEGENRPHSDQRIKEKLKKDYKVSLSRRSVREYRALLRIPSSRKRQKK
jgi:hypothetical protein